MRPSLSPTKNWAAVKAAPPWSSFFVLSQDEEVLCEGVPQVDLAVVVIVPFVDAIEVVGVEPSGVFILFGDGFLSCSDQGAVALGLVKGGDDATHDEGHLSFFELFPHFLDEGFQAFLILGTLSLVGVGFALHPEHAGDVVFDFVVVQILHGGVGGSEKSFQHGAAAVFDGPMLVKGGASGGCFDEVNVVVGISFAHRAAKRQFRSEATHVRRDSRADVLPLAFVPNFDSLGWFFFGLLELVKKTRP